MNRILKRFCGAVWASALAALPANAVTLKTEFSFQSQNQSMFAGGTDPLVTFQKTILDVGLPTRSYSAFANQTNPKWTTWNKGLQDLKDEKDACKDFFCRGAKEAEILAYPITNPQPIKTFKNVGGGVTLGYGLSTGYSGRIGFGDGVVDTTYRGEATTSISDIRSDGTVSIITTKTNSTSTLQSDFADLVLDLDVDTQVEAVAKIRGRYPNTSGKVEDETITLIDFSQTQKTEVISASLSENGLTFGALDLPDEQINVSSFGPSAYYRGLNGSFFKGGISAGSPILALSAKYPEMDIDAVSALGEDVVTGEIEPIDRNIAAGTNLEFNSGPAANSDIARFELDVDGVMGLPFGFGAEIKAPVAGTVIGMETNLVDYDLASYFSLGQTLKFDPRMKVRYEFSTPVQYILANGETSSSFVSTITLGLNEELRIVHPQTPGFSVVPVYTLEDAKLFNEIAGYMDFTFEYDMFQFRLFGLAASALNAEVDASLLKTVAELNADPLLLFTKGSQNVGFELGGFSDFSGQRTLIPGVPTIATVPLPTPLILLSFGLMGLGAMLRRKAG